MGKELCNHPTIYGPCTMEKGHKTPYHRHREYEVMEWEIRVEGKKIESGTNRVPLNYAMKAALNKHDKFTVIVTKRKKFS